MTEDNPEINASSKVVPLTRMSLSSITISKRKSTAQDKNDGEPTRYAPVKRQRYKAKVNPTAKDVESGATNTSGPKPAEYYGLRKPSSQPSRSEVIDVASITNLIEKCIRLNTAVHHDNLRHFIHNLMLEDKFHQFKVTAAFKIILGKAGLLYIINRPDLFDLDVKADAAILFKFWSDENFDAFPLKGIGIEKRGKVVYQTVMDSYEGKKSSAIIGANGLTNGDWVPNRVCGIRDGFHGEREAGICGKSGVGAYSIVLAAGGYADNDNGEIVEYCGTESENSKPTACTTYLRESLVNKNPVRLMRAKGKSKYSPREGIRYDGLYEVTGEEVLNKDKAMYRFTLERLPGQDPIRYKGFEAIPTRQQLEERARIWKALSKI